jgi:radical SAM-linked protein
MTRNTKVRLQFAKRGDLRLVSHRDLLRCLERLLRRAGVPMAMSQGFNPRPRITFALALGLGIEGWREVVDLELSQPMELAELCWRLKAFTPAGLEWIDACALPVGEPPPRPRLAVYHLEIPQDRRESARSTLESFLASNTWPWIRRRPNGQHSFDLRPHVLAAELTPEGLLRFRLKVAGDGSARPDEFLESLALRDLLERGAVIVRTHLELHS